MKRLSLRTKQPRDQKGVSPVDALFAMIIAGMIAAAVTQSMGGWINVRTITANQDAATQHAQGIIAQTSSLEWASLGFDKTPTAPTTPDADCPVGAYRPSISLNGKTYNTVALPDGEDNASGLAQYSSTEIRGKKYCVQTDVTWANPATLGTQSVSSYDTKNVTVKVTWKDREQTRSISVNSSRSPNIGEAIPAGLAKGMDAEASPIQSFSVAKASNDGSSGKICFVGQWSATPDTVKIVSSTTASLYPSTSVAVLMPSDNGVEKCLNVSTTATQGFYGLTINDSAGVKFKSPAKYQFPGSNLGLAGPKVLSWNSYPATGTSKYRIMKSSSPSLTSPTLVAETTDTMYTLGTVSTNSWFWIETVNPNYAVTSKSNTLPITGG